MTKECKKKLLQVSRAWHLRNYARTTYKRAFHNIRTTAKANE